MSFTLTAPVPLIETTTVLPNPTFGDSEASTGSLNILRTMTGRRFVYKKTRGRRKLRWDFRLTRNKAIELLEFYRSYHAKKISIADHNNRIWVGWITNNPFEIEMSSRGAPSIQGWPTGETCAVSVEFEGFLTSTDVREPTIFAPAAESEINSILSQSLFMDISLPTASGSLVNNWDALQVTHPNNTQLSTLPDIGPANNDLVGTIGNTLDPIIDRSPIYRQASPIFNLRPTVAFESVTNGTVGDIASMRTTSPTILFPNRRGTIFWVMAHTINSKWPAYLNTIDSPYAASYSEASRDAFLQDALNDTSFNTDIEYGVWSLESTDGIPAVEQLHMSGSSNPIFPVNARFQPANGNDVRLATLNTNAAPSLQPFIYMLSRDSDTNLRFRTNGIERTGATILNSVPYTGLFHVNDQRYAPAFDAKITGEWGQILTYNKALDTTDIESIEKYLSLRWGIPLLTIPF